MMDRYHSRKYLTIFSHIDEFLLVPDKEYACEHTRLPETKDR